MKSCDTRRWQKGPHLRTSLEYLDAILDYMGEVGLSMYRMSSDLAPYATHPDLPQFHGQVAESAGELAAIGAKARERDFRLSFHPSQYILLNSPDAELTRKSIWDLSSQAEMLDRMELGPEAVVVTHVGGVYGNREESRARWLEGWEKCPEPVKRRLVLENDDLRFSASDVLWIHERCGVRLIFDYQHFWCMNPEGAELRPTLEAFLRSWPEGVRPKVHFSSPRTELREIKRAVKGAERAEAMEAGGAGAGKESGVRVVKGADGANGASGAGGKRRVARAGAVAAARGGAVLKSAVKPMSRVKTVLLPPLWTGHADFTNPFEFATFMRMAEGLDFDVMLEGKCKDLALLKLRPDLLRYAPDVAARFGIFAEAAKELEADERRLEEGVVEGEGGE